MRITGEQAWLRLLTGIGVYELRADDNQLLSHAYTRIKTRWPIITRMAVFIVIAHLEDLLPAWIDPFQGLGFLKRRNLAQLAGIGPLT